MRRKFVYKTALKVSLRYLVNKDIYKIVYFFISIHLEQWHPIKLVV